MGLDPGSRCSGVLGSGADHRQMFIVNTWMLANVLEVYLDHTLKTGMLVAGILKSLVYESGVSIPPVEKHWELLRGTLDAD